MNLWIWYVVFVCDKFVVTFGVLVKSYSRKSLISGFIFNKSDSD